MMALVYSGRLGPQMLFAYPPEGGVQSASVPGAWDPAAAAQVAARGRNMPPEEYGQLLAAAQGPGGSWQVTQIPDGSDPGTALSDFRRRASEQLLS